MFKQIKKYVKNKKEIGEAVGRQHKVAAAHNWEVQHGPYDFYPDPKGLIREPEHGDDAVYPKKSAQVAKVKKGKVSTWNQAKKVGKVYPLKTSTIHPDLITKNTVFVDKYSPGNPHAHEATVAQHDQDRWLQHYARK